MYAHACLHARETHNIHNADLCGFWVILIFFCISSVNNTHHAHQSRFSLSEGVLLTYNIRFPPGFIDTSDKTLIQVNIEAGDTGPRQWYK